LLYFVQVCIHFLIDFLLSGPALFSSPAVDQSDGSDEMDSYNAFAADKKRKQQYHLTQKNSMNMLSDDSSSSDSEQEDDICGNVKLGDHTVVSTAKGKGNLSNVKKTTVWSGDPGSTAGHVASHVSSYFSRLWKNGNKNRVWYLYLKKESS
jgi:hypothetical protein